MFFSILVALPVAVNRTYRSTLVDCYGDFSFSSFLFFLAQSLGTQLMLCASKNHTCTRTPSLHVHTTFNHCPPQLRDLVSIAVLLGVMLFCMGGGSTNFRPSSAIQSVVHVGGAGAVTIERRVHGG